MDGIMLESYYNWFKDYVKSFYSQDPDINYHIGLKEEHTYRVCEYSKAISQSIQLSQSDFMTAETIALFHDIGRFPQYQQYKTFSDARSKDHAVLGQEVLREAAVLEGLDQRTQSLIIKAIGSHNACDISTMKEEKLLLHSRLIRDADKLDIYEIITNYYEHPQNFPHLKVGESLNSAPGYSPHILDDILNCRKIKYSSVKTSDDMKLVRLTWVFDINFQYTFSKILEKEYIQRIINTLPKNPETIRVEEHILVYMYTKVKDLQM